MAVATRAVAAGPVDTSGGSISEQDPTESVVPAPVASLSVSSDAHPPPNDSVAPNAPPFSHPAVSYARVVATSSSLPPTSQGTSPAVSAVARPRVKDRFPDVPLPSRQYGSKEGVPTITFSSSEHQALTQRIRHTIVAKFQSPRPPLSTIKVFVDTHWRIKGRLSMSSNWDAKHVVFMLDSEEDVKEALICPFRKVQHAYFRLFRWTPEFNPKKESTLVTKWIKLPGLPMEFFTRSCVKAIVSSFAHFLSIDDHTCVMNSLQCARACVELDVAKQVPSRVWISAGDQSFFQDIVVEGGLAYCIKCKTHGHDFSSCRKSNKSIPSNQPAKDHIATHQAEIASDQPLSEEQPALTKALVSHDDDVLLSNTNEAAATDAVEEPQGLSPETGADEPKTMASTASDPMPENPESRALVNCEDVVVTLDDDTIEMIKTNFERMRPYLETEGIFSIPEKFDDDFIDRWNRAGDKLPVSEDDAEATPSDWLPANKKKKKKNKHPRKSDGDRRSSRVRSEVNNPDFIYHARGM